MRELAFPNKPYHFSDQSYCCRTWRGMRNSVLVCCTWMGLYKSESMKLIYFYRSMVDVIYITQYCFYGRILRIVNGKKSIWIWLNQADNLTQRPTCSNYFLKNVLKPLTCRVRRSNTKGPKSSSNRRPQKTRSLQKTRGKLHLQVFNENDFLSS